MKPKTAYLTLTVLGAVIPYCAFVPWLFQADISPGLFVRDLFANRISTFFALDLIISAVVLLGFIRRESSRLRIPRVWPAVLATLLIGVSCGFPLFLYLRELRSKAEFSASLQQSVRA